MDKKQKNNREENEKESKMEKKTAEKKWKKNNEENEKSIEIQKQQKIKLKIVNKIPKILKRNKIKKISKNISEKMPCRTIDKIRKGTKIENERKVRQEVM